MHEGSSESSPASVSVRMAVLTVSDTRTLADDRSGAVLVELLEQAKHRLVARAILRDEPELIRERLRAWIADEEIEVVLVTGGTGLTARDVSPEALAPLISKPIPGFGELFRMLSWQEIQSAAMLSRATAGVVRGAVVFALPGSPHGVRLALEKLIVPELPHLFEQLAR